MSDSIAGSYAALAGIEIVNDARTFAYLKNGLGPDSISVYGNCGCPNLVDLLACPGATGYDTPASDSAPWYTADIPASSQFLGFVVDEFEGLNSPFKRSVQQSVTNGGVLSRGRLGTREMTWRGFLFGASCCGTLYGLNWLTQTLSRFSTECRDCLGDDLELLVCCPDDTEAATGTSSPFRTLKGVGLLEGPNILSQHKTCTSRCTTGCGGSCVLEIEFTLVATQPYLYSPEIPIYDCIDFATNASATVIDPEEPCPPFDCGQELLDSIGLLVPGFCDPVVLPPTATYQNPCFDNLIADLGDTVYVTVPRSYWPRNEEVVPVISLTNTGAFYNEGVKLGIFRSFDGNPCGELINNAPDCDALCDDLLISPIPPNSTFYIDGRTRKMSVICADGSAWAGEKLTNGPWSWPVFTDMGFCLAIQFVNDFPDLCVSLSLVPRSF